MHKYALPAAFSIPFATLDEEHEGLIQQLNQLLTRMGTQTAAETARMADGFLTGLREHFANEEALMAEVGYPGLAEHRAHHAECLSAMAAILEGARNQGAVDPAQIDEAFSLFVNTLVRVDLYFEEFLIGIGLVADRAKPV